MQLSSVLLTLVATFSLVRADLYSDCLASFRKICDETHLDPEQVSKLYTSAGDCRGCPFYAIAIASRFEINGRPVVGQAAFKELMTLC